MELLKMTNDEFHYYFFLFSACVPEAFALSSTSLYSRSSDQILVHTVVPQCHGIGCRSFQVSGDVGVCIVCIDFFFQGTYAFIRGWQRTWVSRRCACINYITVSLDI